jgi:hypothetical protein
MSEERTLRMTEKRRDELDKAIDFWNNHVIQDNTGEELIDSMVGWWVFEPPSRPISEIREYIKAVTHLPCACQACQLKRSILFWAFPTLEKEDWYK